MKTNNDSLRSVLKRNFDSLCIHMQNTGIYCTSPRTSLRDSMVEYVLRIHPYSCDWPLDGNDIQFGARKTPEGICISAFYGRRCIVALGYLYINPLPFSCEGGWAWLMSSWKLEKAIFIGSQWTNENGLSIPPLWSRYSSALFLLQEFIGE